MDSAAAGRPARAARWVVWMTLSDKLAERDLDWIIPDWPAPANVQSLMTTRNGGASSGHCATMNLAGNHADDPQHVERNQALLREVIGIEPRWLSQVHGTDVAMVDAPAQRWVADAAIATTPGIAAAVRVADCLPVLFCDRDGTRVAAAHAGWRGLAAGVLERTVEAMHVPPGGIIAWLGPAIGLAAFEVGDDVRDAFIAHEAARASGCARPASSPSAAAAFAPTRIPTASSRTVATRARAGWPRSCG